jgi:hypothetical protein
MSISARLYADFRRFKELTRELKAQVIPIKKSKQKLLRFWHKVGNKIVAKRRIKV